MNRRTFLSSTAAAFAPRPIFSAAPPSSGAARFRTAICAYSFRDALKAKTMTYDDLVRLVHAVMAQMFGRIDVVHNDAGLTISNNAGKRS